MPQNYTFVQNNLTMNNYQEKVNEWMHQCFGAEISNDVQERNYRFLEEALELVQALGCTYWDVIKLVNYVFARPLGEEKQEVGGVMVTLAALCNAKEIDMINCGDEELKRVFTKIEQIREKQLSKPHNSPLPQ